MSEIAENACSSSETEREKFLYIYFLEGFFFGTIFSTAYSAAPQTTVPTDAGIEPRTVATGALAVRRSNH
jgi:hypothetical protein